VGVLAVVAVLWIRSYYRRVVLNHAPSWSIRTLPWWVSALFFIAIFAAMVFAVKVGAD
jgi:hypothetical protein